jgi:hypothetical protein
MTTSEPPIDQLLSHALRVGGVANLLPATADGDRVEEATMRGWSSDHEVDATLIRDLLLGRLVDQPDPRGLMLRGARIRGPLDLDRVDTAIALTLLDCLIEDGVFARQAHLPALAMARCRIGVVGSPAELNADHLRLDGHLQLDGCVVIAATAGAAVSLRGARVGGQLSLAGTTVTNTDGPALAAELLHAGHVMLHLGFHAEGCGPSGAVRLLNAHATGQINLSGAQLANPSGPALLADHVHTGEGIFLGAGFEASGFGHLSTVRLSDARISGGLTLTGATIGNTAGPALRADRLEVGADLWMNTGLRAVGVGEEGAVSLLAARVGGMVDTGGAQLRNADGPALVADELSTGGNVLFSGGFYASGTGADAAVRLLGSRIGGELQFGRALVLNCRGPAVAADQSHVAGKLIFNGEFRAGGVGTDGVVRLSGVRVDGQVIFSGARMSNPAGPVILADGLHTGGHTVFHQGFAADGTDPTGAVRLSDARIGGQLRLGLARVSNLVGPALRADRAAIASALVLDRSFTARGGGRRGAVTLIGTRVGALLNLSDTMVSSRSGLEYRWELDGLTYHGLPRIDGTLDRAAWLNLFATKTPTYAAQPYQQLAAAYRAAGHDDDVRAILIEQRRDQVHRGTLSWADRKWAGITGALLGYGYRPWRALGLLGVVIGISVVLALALGPHGALIEVSAPAPGLLLGGAQQGVPCSLTEEVARGLDLGTPLLPRLATKCALSGSATGVALTWSTWALQLLAWALGTLSIAGVTGIVRKT